MVTEVHSGNVPMVMLRKSRTRPKILLVGPTRSLCNLSQEMGSCLTAVLNSPSRMKIASMLAAIAYSRRRVSAMSR